MGCVCSVWRAIAVTLLATVLWIHHPTAALAADDHDGINLGDMNLNVYGFISGPHAGNNFQTTV